VPDLSLRPSFLAKVFLCRNALNRHNRFDAHKLI
jgi:hypothetical protein